MVPNVLADGHVLISEHQIAVQGFIGNSQAAAEACQDQQGKRQNGCSGSAQPLGDQTARQDCAADLKVTEKFHVVVRDRREADEAGHEEQQHEGKGEPPKLPWRCHQATGTRNRNSPPFQTQYRRPGKLMSG